MPAGSQGRGAARRWLAPLLPIALACVLFGWGLGTLPFYTRGEPREALVVWDPVLDRSRETGPKGDRRLVLLRAESRVAARLPAPWELRAGHGASQPVSERTPPLEGAPQ